MKNLFLKNSEEEYTHEKEEAYQVTKQINKWKTLLFKILLTPSFAFLNCFIWGITLATHTSIKFIVSSKLIYQILSLNIFYKKLLNICHANCSRIMSRFAMPSRLLIFPTVLNQMRFLWNCILLKFISVSKKASVLVISHNILVISHNILVISHNILLSTSTKIFITWE